MEHVPEYVKEIETYFLTLAGEGLMLSSIDYSLIQDWKKRNIPKEVVLRGINRAFAERSEGKNRGTDSPRNLRHCAGYVEKCIEEYGPLIKKVRSGRDKESKPGSVKGDIEERLESFINDEKDSSIRDYYIRLRKKVLGLDKQGGETYLSQISLLEEESLEEFFNGLPEKEREKISLEAEKMINERARFMTKSAYDESLISFRNEILGKKYGIKCIIS